MSIIVSMLKEMFPSKERRVLLMGLDAVGKTQLLYQLVLGQVITTIPTIGFNVETVKHDHSELLMWDIGGCDKIRPLWKHYFQGTHGVIFVIDSNDRERLAEAWSIYLMLQEDTMKGVPVAFAANKIDLPNCMTTDQIAEELKLHEIVDREVMIFPVFALGGDGLPEMLTWLCEAMDRYVSQEAIIVSPPSEEEKSQSKLEEWLNRHDEPDDVFLENLETFSLQSWDHRTHLRLAWLYITRHGRKEGMKRIFKSIKAFILNSDHTNGRTFHETMTYFWSHMVHYAIE